MTSYDVGSALDYAGVGYIGERPKLTTPTTTEVTNGREELVKQRWRAEAYRGEVAQ